MTTEPEPRGPGGPKGCITGGGTLGKSGGPTSGGSAGGEGIGGIEGIVPRPCGARWAGTVQELREIDVEGTWYRWLGIVDAKNRVFKKDDEFRDIPFTLGPPWTSDEGERLVLPPGKHRVRVAFLAQIENGLVAAEQ